MTTEILDTKAQDARACFVPISKLTVHADNVRRTDKRADIEPLAASIASHGLLQNLSVVRGEDGRYAVVAGARRLAALRLLAKQGRIARDFAAPCTIVDGDLSSEASLAENVQRVAMNPMDEMEALVALVDGGMSVEDVAARFGATVRHVEQRLALGRLSPRLRAAYRKGEITLDVARAFCLSDDHETQERLFKQFGKPITHAGSVRAALSGGRIPATDKIARFVGLEAYGAAGGRIVRDLFEDNVAFLDDGDILQRLAAERAETLRQELIQEGWGWTEVQLAHGHIEGCASERLRPTQKPLSPEDGETITALTEEIESLDAQLENDEDNAALWNARDAAEARLDALRQASQAYDPSHMAHAGAIIAIAQDGSPFITRGLIKRADLKSVRKLQKADRSPTPEDGESDQDRVLDDPGPRLPKTLVEELSGARTRALRAELCQNPHTALALLVYVLLRRSVAHERVPGIEIESRCVGFEDDDILEQRRTELLANIPEDPSACFGMCVDLPIQRLLDALALLVAETLDFTHLGVGPQDPRVQDMSDALAGALHLDMTRHWEATVEFWEKAPKAYALTALEASPTLADLSAASRKARLTALSKMKKAELARTAVKILGPTWLPELLITPTSAGAYQITTDGEAALAEAAAGAHAA